METWALVLIGGLLYFFPGFVAHLRRHRNENAIVLANLFFGWTVVGWIVALIWAATANVKE